MTERLTKRNSDGAYFDGTNGKMAMDKYGRTYGEAAEKLAHYEDLEEQGRLHIVPKGFWKAIVTYLVNDKCPYDFGLKGFNEEDCKADDEHCKECWEKALKGGTEDVSRGNDREATKA